MITISDIDRHDEKLNQNDHFLVEAEQSRVALDKLLTNTKEKFHEILLYTVRNNKLKNYLNYEIRILYPQDKSTYAGIKNDGGYCIKISVPFMRKIFVYSDLIAEKYTYFWEESFQIKTSKSEIRDMLFCSYCLIILCHEAGHILNGHLDFLIDKKLITTTESITIDYLEILTINNFDNYIENIEEINNDDQDIWFAIESEADAFAAQSAAFLLNRVDEIRKIVNKIEGINKNNEIAYKFYGYILATLFHFYDLISSSKDIRHPKPFVRMYISAASFNQLVEIKNGTKKDYETILHVLLKAYWEICDVLNFYENEPQKIKQEYSIEAISLMKKIPYILNKIDISLYRKK